MQKVPDGIVVTLIEEGRKATIRGTAHLVDRVYQVTDADGEVVGYVSRRLVNRERRTPGKRYVDARWRVAAWGWSLDQYGRFREVPSKAAGVEGLLRDHARRAS